MPPLKTKEPPKIRNRRIVGIVKAARYAGVSRWTVRAWVLEGRLRWVRYPCKGGGYRTMIDLDDMDRFIDGKKEKAIVREPDDEEGRGAGGTPPQ